MNWTHLHLALNHVPVLGTPFLLLLLAWGWVRKSREITHLAVLWLVPFAALAIALKFTGDFAAEHPASGLTEPRPYLSQHEQAADRATLGVFALGLLAGVALWQGRRGRVIEAWLLGALLAVGLVTTGLYVRAAQAGGWISHPELRPVSSTQP
jgi:uncharacterized membrane protein